MSRRRTREKKRKRATGMYALSTCICCGQPGPHYVPPSFGDKGFFICEIVNRARA